MNTATAAYAFGDILLVPFPFTDQSASKNRPAVVVSPKAYNEAHLDIIVMPITSQIKPAMALGEVAVSQWKSAGLLKPSVVKPIITTLDKRLVRHRPGKLKNQDQQSLRNAIAVILG